MSDLNEEWAQSIIRLGLIEKKKALLPEIGQRASYMHPSMDEHDAKILYECLRHYSFLDALLRDDKATSKLAAEVVKASRK
jgi:hypothetical protein